MNNLDERIRSLIRTIGEGAPEPPALRTDRKPTRRSVARGPLVATASFVVVIGLFVGLGLIFGGSDQPTVPDGVAGGEVDGEQSSQVEAQPIEPSIALGSDYIWPEPLDPSGPETVAERFAQEVLGWENPTITPDPEAAENAPTWVTIADDAGHQLNILVAPRGSSGWGTVQIGEPSVIVATPLGYASIRTPEVPGATQVVVYASTAEGTTLAWLADLSDNPGTIVLPGIEVGEVMSLLVAYKDEAGRTVTANGGQFGPFELEPAGPEITIAEGRFEGSDYFWRLSAFQATDGTLCIRLQGMGCVGDIPPGAHLGAVLTMTAFGVAEDDRWCVWGDVVDAAAVEIYLSDGSRTTAPIFTDSDFDVDFYAYCAFGSQLADEIVALDSSDNIIDTALSRSGD